MIFSKETLEEVKNKANICIYSLPVNNEPLGNIVIYRGTDAINYLMENENMSFILAIVELCKRFNIIPKFHNTEKKKIPVAICSQETKEKRSDVLCCIIKIKDHKIRDTIMKYYLSNHYDE